MEDRKKSPWFRVKRYGHGVGLPIAWQGWVVLLLYVVMAFLSAVLLPRFVGAGMLILLTAIVVYIAYVRSDDDWRWRGD